MLTYNRLISLLDYNALTGIFRWKESRGVLKGSIAGSRTTEGYISITIDGYSYQAHRIAWFYYYGYMPEINIDHRDRIKHHNWILNLRMATQVCNVRNTGLRLDNKSGVKGVGRSSSCEMWYAQIGINNKTKSLGYYKDFDEAVCARLMGEQCLDWAGCDSSSYAYLYVQDMLGNVPNEKEG